MNPMSISATSEAIRSFYERRPYPAPLTSLDGHRDLYSNRDRSRALFHLMWPGGAVRDDLDILVAGCGTSQGARFALREPRSRVTAIDISDTSLRYTKDLQQKYRLENLRLHRLSIEDIGQLGCTFDQIVCTGVLHHLPDPDVGLRALRDVLRMEGAMHLMVYAPYGRAGIYMIQEYCRLLGVDASDGDLTDLAATLDALPADHPIAGIMRVARDFRHPDALADALLHPNDRAYTVTQIHAWLMRCGLSFTRWFEQAPYSPRCGMLAKTPHADRLSSLPAVAQHAAVELFRGTMTRHSLIAHRDDRAGDTHVITFAGECWHKYVPMVLPWTVCIRERLPPGAVAVLINRAHPFPDLALSVDSFNDQLLSAIDGKRTIATIMERANVSSGSIDRARRFFEMLWDYDQVVFDTTTAASPGQAG